MALAIAVTILQATTMAKASITTVESSLDQVGLKIIMQIRVASTLAASVLNQT